MSEKYMPEDGDPIDMSQVRLGPRYGAEDMYRDLGSGSTVSFEKDGMVYTECVESVNYRSGSPSVYRHLNWGQSLLRRLTPRRWRRSLLVRPAELSSVTINGPKKPVGKTLEQIEAIRGMFER